MDAAKRLLGLETELAACHQHGAHEFQQMANLLDRQADEEESAGRDSKTFRDAAARVRAAGERYRELHR